MAAYDEKLEASPKYAQGRPRRDGYQDTMARLFVKMSPGDVPDASERLTTLLQKLCVTNGALSGYGYIEFLLQEANHSYSEKMDVYETLAHKYVSYVFGATPPLFSYAALLLNNRQDDQADNLFRLYWEVLRALSVAEYQAPVRLLYNNMLVSGSLTSLMVGHDSVDESVCRCSFNILVKKVDHLPNTDYVSAPDYGVAAAVTPSYGSPAVSRYWGQQLLPPPTVAVSHAPVRSDKKPEVAPPTAAASQAAAAAQAQDQAALAASRRLKLSTPALLKKGDS